MWSRHLVEHLIEVVLRLPTGIAIIVRPEVFNKATMSLSNLGPVWIGRGVKGGRVEKG